MTIHDQTAGNDDPKSVLLDLQRSMLAESGAGDGTADKSALARDEQRLARAVAAAAPEFPAMVRAAADGVIPVLAPRPEARARMIAAASRALAERRKSNGLLPVLLRAAREQSGLELDGVAASSGLEEELLAALESGQTSVDRIEAETVGRWINAVAAPREKAVAALKRSLLASWTGEPLLAAGSEQRPADIDSFIAIVERTLDTQEQA